KTYRESVDRGGLKVAEDGGEVAESRKSVSRAEVNAGSVAAFLQVKVLVSDMPRFMQVHAFKCARRIYDSLEKFSPVHGLQHEE
ncbi:axonemal dynein light chain, partial [Olea europaea subsp. europaea]